MSERLIALVGVGGAAYIGAALYRRFTRQSRIDELERALLKTTADLQIMGDRLSELTAQYEEAAKSLRFFASLKITGDRDMAAAVYQERDGVH